MVVDTGEHQMEEMHGAGYVGRGLEFTCFLWVLHSPSISPCSDGSSMNTLLWEYLWRLPSLALEYKMKKGKG